MAVVANDEPQKHLGRDITVGIIDKQSTPSTDCPWVPSSHYIATEYGLLIDIGSMEHLYDIDAIAICDVVLLRITLSKLSREWHYGKSSQWMRAKWRYLQIAHVFGVKCFIVAVTPHSKKQFYEMKGNIKRMVNQMNIDKFRIIPLSNRTGDNDNALTELPTANVRQN